MLFMRPNTKRPRVVIEKFIPFARILENKQLSQILAYRLSKLYNIIYIDRLSLKAKVSERQKAVDKLN